MSAVVFAEGVKDRLVPIETLIEYEGNPRRGDTKALRESILANTFYTVLAAQSSTRKVIAGNHRLRVLRELGATEAPVAFIDCSDDDARRIVLADNRTSDLAFYDDPSLFQLLQALDGDFTGTGYDRSSYELLLQGMEAADVLGNIAQGNIPEDRIDAYLDNDLRNIVLPYAGDEYDEIAKGLMELREREGFNTNAAAVAWLVRMAVE